MSPTAGEREKSLDLTLSTELSSLERGYSLCLCKAGRPTVRGKTNTKPILPRTGPTRARCLSQAIIGQVWLCTQQGRTCTGLPKLPQPEPCPIRLASGWPQGSPLDPLLLDFQRSTLHLLSRDRLWEIAEKPRPAPQLPGVVATASTWSESPDLHKSSPN
jgi:hypothetical protein